MNTIAEHTKALLPANLGELAKALGLLTENSLILAGGTDLILQMREKHLHPDYLLSLEGIPELKEIRMDESRLSLGSMASIDQIDSCFQDDPELRALSTAAHLVGSQQIRNKGTVGGNVANASPASDLSPVLRMYDAAVELLGPDNRRYQIPIRDFMPGNHHTTRQYNEVILRFLIDRRALRGYRSCFAKLGHRKQVSISRIGIVMGIRTDPEGIVEEARFVAGAIRPAPLQLPEVEAFLVGKKLSPALAPAIGAMIAPYSRRAYKAFALKGVVEDTIMKIMEKP